jgi:uncharacterized protein with NRDE domain
MCLILFSHDCHPHYRLVLLANRDEFYRRPTAPLHFWPDEPRLLAGRDLERRGTWLGITTGGRWAGLTNYRDPSAPIQKGPSRGTLVADFLRGDDGPAAYLEKLSARDGRINGYSLIAGDRGGLYYHCSRRPGVTTIAPGIHGLSNGLLGAPWPKVKKGTDRLRRLLGKDNRPPLEAFFELLADPLPFPDPILPDTGVGPAWERLLSPLFIVSPQYGTRSSTVILIDRQQRATVAERTYNGGGMEPPAAGTRRFDLLISS